MALKTVGSSCRTWILSTFCHTPHNQILPRSLLVYQSLKKGQITAVRFINSKKRARRREEKKQQISQYVGDNADPVERVYVWGNAVTGALGISSYLKPEKSYQKPIQKQWRPARLRFLDQHGYKVKDVACGYGFTLYVVMKSASGPRKVLVTGINTDSQLGFYEVPRKSGRILEYVIEPITLEMPLTYPQTTNIKSVACGRAHSLIMTDKEGVFSLGNNSYGQCGRPVVEGEVFNKVSNIQRLETLPDDITKIVCGQDHSFFLTGSGEVYSCGLGADGQTGLGHYNATGRPTLVKGDIAGVKIVDISSTADCVLALSDNNELFGWGNSEYHQLSIVTNETQVNTPKHLPLTDCGKIIQAATGGSICAILNDLGQVFVWGFGILGKGPMLANSDRPSKIPETLFGRNELQPDTNVKSITCGLTTFAAITDRGDLYTWGKNKEGCLGLWEMKDQYFPLKVAMPAETYRVVCGVDHMVALCRSFT